MGLKPEPMDLAPSWLRFGLVGLVGHSQFHIGFLQVEDCELSKIRKGNAVFLIITHQQNAITIEKVEVNTISK